jgi:uncharacterized protein (TIGR02246 family)
MFQGRSLAACVLLAGCFPVAVAAAENEESRIAQSMMARFVDSWNRADGAMYGEGYWMDAELVDPTGAIWQGRAAIAQMHVDLWNTAFQGSRVAASVRKIRRLGREHLIVDLDLSLSGAKGLPPGAAADSQGIVHTHLKHVMERRGGVWRIVAAQNTFYTPAPQGTAPTPARP